LENEEREKVKVKTIQFTAKDPKDAKEREENAAKIGARLGL
jgi:hypothetical protein